MEEYNYLIQKIDEYNQSMKDIFEKRLSVLEKLLSLEDKSNGSNVSIDLNKINNIESNTNNTYTNEYSYFMKNLNSLDKKVKYSRIQNDDVFENINIDETSVINTVCYQGLPCSYSESASKSLFKDKTYIHKESFEGVFKEVHAGLAEVGVLPIENSTAGYINDVYDLLLKYNLYINYNYVKKIEHCLAGTTNSTFEDIKDVYSHPQAIMQCKEFLENNNLRAVNEINTAVAAQKIHDMDNKSIACICSTEAASHYGLKIIREQINHRKENYTRFAAISKHLLIDDKHNKISIVFQIPHKTGSLDGVLSLFAYYNINLLSIYSRPDANSPWKYMFYVDIEGNILSNRIKSVLSQLKEELPFIKILGSFQA